MHFFKLTKGDLGKIYLNPTYLDRLLKIKTLTNVPTLVA